NEPADDPVVLTQISGRDAGDLLRRHGAEPLDVARQVPPVAEMLEVAQRECLARDTIPAVRKLRLRLAESAVELLTGRWLAGQALQLVQKRGFHLLPYRAFADRERDGEEIGVQAGADTGAH